MKLWAKRIGWWLLVAAALVAANDEHQGGSGIALAILLAGYMVAKAIREKP